MQLPPGAARMGAWVTCDTEIASKGELCDGYAPQLFAGAVTTRMGPQKFLRNGQL